MLRVPRGLRLSGRRLLSSSTAIGGGFGHTLEMASARPGFYTLTLSRPEVHNAINDEMIAGISDTLDNLRTSPPHPLRALYLRGAGKSFCAGGDLQWMKRAATLSTEENERDALRLSRMLNKLATLPCATIALVQGNAFGGGVGMISACDMAVSVKSAKFGLTEARLGLIPATISPYVVPRIGPAQSRRYFLTGERFDAAKANEIGLLHELAEDEMDLESWAEHFASELMLSAPTAVAAGKDLIAAVEGRERDDELLLETARRLSRQRDSDEGREGIGAFFEKRKAAWTSMA